MSEETIVVIGLGYVGLPLTVALSRYFDVIGLDINPLRIQELRAGYDRTGEVDDRGLAETTAHFTDDPSQCRGAQTYIVTVPTPVDSANKPDLGPLRSASRMISGLLDGRRDTVIVYESTVYPGVTEDICGPILEEGSGLVCGRDFHLGYSPERINPGDRVHRIERIVKVVAGQTPEITDRIARIYGTITEAGVFRAASIKAAEAAKVIENAQRDINIAFMNEITQIFSKLDVSVWDVLDAAKTKWNFLPFEPGLVGGHCIGVDPYYLSFRAQELGHEPDVILSGRYTNDRMGSWVADSIHAQRNKPSSTALILGLTFKENVPDLRNSRVVDVIRRFQELGYDLAVHDPMADPQEALEEYGIELREDALKHQYDTVFSAVAHDKYKNLSASEVEKMVKPNGMIADLKGIWRGVRVRDDIDRWSL